MAAKLFNRNGRIRVWAMTPPYRAAYIALEPTMLGAFELTEVELNALIHDITAATRVIQGQPKKGSGK